MESRFSEEENNFKIDYFKGKNMKNYEKGHVKFIESEKFIGLFLFLDDFSLVQRIIILINFFENTHTFSSFFFLIIIIFLKLI